MKKQTVLSFVLTTMLAGTFLTACDTLPIQPDDNTTASPTSQSAPVTTGQSSTEPEFKTVDRKLIPATAEWADQIRAVVRSNLVPPKNLKGRPKAEFLVSIKPDGTIIDTKLTKSSGNKALDDAIRRAILKSSPLPLPLQPEAFQKDLRLVFDPLNN